MSDWLVRLLATGGGVGYVRFASGTFGTLPPLALTMLLAMALQGQPLTGWLLLALAVVTTLLAVPVATRAETLFGGKDSGRIVVDEVTGYFWTVALLPLPAGGWPLLRALLTAFLLFRLFDIWKPWPVRGLQRLAGGYGVVLDDVVAGLYANIVLRLLLHVHG